MRVEGGGWRIEGARLEERIRKASVAKVADSGQLDRGMGGSGGLHSRRSEEACSGPRSAAAEGRRLKSAAATASHPQRPTPRRQEGTEESFFEVFFSSTTGGYLFARGVGCGKQWPCWPAAPRWLQEPAAFRAHIAPSNVDFSFPDVEVAPPLPRLVHRSCSHRCCCGCSAAIRQGCLKSV